MKLTADQQQVITLCACLRDLYGSIWPLKSYAIAINKAHDDGIITANEASLLRIHASLRRYTSYRAARLKAGVEDTMYLSHERPRIAYLTNRITFDERCLLEDHKDTLERYFKYG